MSEELPFYITTTSTETRRRHPNNSTTNQNHINPITANNAQSNFHHHSNLPHHQQDQLNASSSLGNFSSLFVPSASNFWNAAQTSLQSFADQINDFNKSEEKDSQSIFDGKNTKDTVVPAYIPLIEMPFRDRTIEFRTVAKSCQVNHRIQKKTYNNLTQLRHQPNGNLATSKTEREKVLQSSIQFNQLAK